MYPIGNFRRISSVSKIKGAPKDAVSVILNPFLLEAPQPMQTRQFKKKSYFISTFLIYVLDSNTQILIIPPT
jgi:hypothetical protein